MLMMKALRLRLNSCLLVLKKYENVMKPLNHARNSVKKWSGVVEDYIPIHNFFDSTKANYADMKHRAILHSTFGIFLVEKVFGTYITNSDGRRVSVRDIGEQHVLEDLGTIPTMERWLRNMPREDWMYGTRRGKSGKTRHIPFDNVD